MMMELDSEPSDDGKNTPVKSRRRTMDFGHLIEFSAGKLSVKSWFPGSQEVVTVKVENDKGEFHLEPSVRERAFLERVHLALSDPTGSKVGFYVLVVVVFLITLSCVTFVLESMPEFLEYDKGCEGCKPLSREEASNTTLVQWRAARNCRGCEPASHPAFWVIEVICISIFTVEYLSRLVTSPFRFCHKEEEISQKELSGEFYQFENNRTLLRLFYFCTDLLNIIDLISILPFYVQLFGLLSGAKLAVVRVFRLVRLFRVSKLGKFTDGLIMFSRVMVDSVIGFALLGVFITFGTIVFGALIFYVERGDWDPTTGVYMRQSLFYLDPKEPSPFSSIPVAFWFVLVTFSTVGYGDMSPTTGGGQVLGVFIMYVGIIFLALPITIIGVNFTGHFDALQRKIKQENEEERQRAQAVVNLFLKSDTGPMTFSFRHWLNDARIAIQDREDARRCILRGLKEFHKEGQQPSTNENLKEDVVELVRSEVQKHAEPLSAALGDLLRELRGMKEARQEP